MELINQFENAKKMFEEERFQCVGLDYAETMWFYKYCKDFQGLESDEIQNKFNSIYLLRYPEADEEELRDAYYAPICSAKYHRWEDGENISFYDNFPKWEKDMQDYFKCIELVDYTLPTIDFIPTYSRQQRIKKFFMASREYYRWGFFTWNLQEPFKKRADFFQSMLKNSAGYRKIFMRKNFTADEVWFVQNMIKGYPDTLPVYERKEDGDDAEQIEIKKADKKPCKHGYCIYIHRNKTNGKVYVGQTNNPSRRWGSGGVAYKSNKHFYSAILKYGWKDGFDHEILCDSLTKEEADIKEREFIELYEAANPDKGYNLTPGGEYSPATAEAIEKTNFRRYNYRLPPIKRLFTDAEAMGFFMWGTSNAEFSSAWNETYRSQFFYKNLEEK